MQCLSTSLICVALAGFSPVAKAQSAYPNKPIRMIVPGAPGGLTDMGARILAPRMGELLGQPIVSDSRSGAAGLIACEIVAKAMPDGYTLLFGFSGPLVILPALNSNAPYDATRDFAPLMLVATSPYVLLVHPGVAAKSVKELVALAKAQPGKLNYASGGVGTGIHMSAELLNLSAGIKTVHVTYKSASPALTALIAGEVEMMFVGISQALPFVKAGKLRALAIGGAKRSPMMQDLPTIAESGYAVDASGWYGVLAPRQTPRPVIDKLHGVLTQVMNEPQVLQRLNDNALVPDRSSPEQFAAFIRAEVATWRKVVEAAGLKNKSNL